MARHIRHPYGYDETDGAAKEARDGVANDGGGGVEAPGALPDDGAAGDDGQTGEDEHDDADVVHLGADVAGGQDDDEAEAAEGELEEDRVEAVPAKGRHDEGAEAADRAVDRVRRGHHQEDQPDFDVQHGLLELRGLELGAPHASLSVAEPFHGRKPLLLGQEPGRHGRVGQGKAKEAKEERQGSGEQVDVLPALEPASRDLGEAVVEGAADDGEQARAAEPPALAQRLLRLRVVAGHDAHEARGDDALDEAEEEALHVQALPGGDGRRQHADGRPEDHDGAEDAADVEALQGKGHGVQAAQHAEVEERRGPAEAARVDGWRDG